MNTSKSVSFESIAFDKLAKVTGGVFKCTDPKSPFFNDPRAGGVAPCVIGNPNPQAEIPNGG